ncbi:hypothetical protein BDZ85DRAFT_44759 [Elsinoe ampelina]|uniref:Uncharacterized protein n=1 Tax=Elsinoe ampelina TaxID=302913 RepID=A0A6A6G0Z0_9PEZI|nr:hypothetical protein BDZ85DRAFT_44759 [Elsinoe ampelina]
MTDDRGRYRNLTANGEDGTVTPPRASSSSGSRREESPNHVTAYESRFLEPFAKLPNSSARSASPQSEADADRHHASTQPTERRHSTEATISEQFTKAEQDVLVVSSRWPKQPRHLRVDAGGGIIFAALELVIALAPLLFLILAAVAYSLDEKPVLQGAPRWYNDSKPLVESRLGVVAEEAAKLGPTVFPVLFAAVVGSALKVFARYLAERSPQKLGMLEMLTGSRTVLSTVESQVLLWRATWLGLGLTCLWSLSPLGGQASLRLLSRETRMVDSPLTVYYVNTALTGLYRRLRYEQARAIYSTSWDNHSFYDSPNFAASEFPALQAVLLASMNAPTSTQASNEDLWNNVRIPRISRLANVTKDADGWKAVPENLGKLDYASMTGVPITTQRTYGPASLTGMDQDAELRFVTEYTYQEVTCTTTDRGSGDDWWLPMIAEPWVNVTDGQMSAESRPIINKRDFTPVNLTETSMFFSFNYTIDLDSNDNPRLLTNVSLPAGNARALQLFVWSDRNTAGTPALGMANCTLQQEIVEARILCRASNCTTETMRPSTRLASADQIVADVDGEVLRAMAMLNPTLLGRQQGGVNPLNTDGSPGAAFLLGSDSPSSSVKYPGDTRLVFGHDVPELGPRLSLLVNTYSDFIMHGRDITRTNRYPDIVEDAIYSDGFYKMGNMTTAKQVQDFIDGPDLRNLNKDRDYVYSAAQGEMLTPQVIYSCNVVWFVVLLIASGALTAIGLTGFLLEKRILAPDTIGYVSSHTYDNPYVPIPAASTLDGMERSRLLFDLEVRIGDVRTDDQAGHVAFAAETDTFHIGKLDRNRKYL